MVCSEAVDLPCPVPWDPQVRYTVSWAKVSGLGFGGLIAAWGATRPGLATLGGWGWGASPVAELGGVLPLASPPPGTGGLGFPPPGPQSSPCFQT